MAERIIGLRIELNGFKGVVTNIKQLEDELKKAKQDLNELEIGGDLFKQLTGEISRAEGQLMNLRKASEGIGLEKQLEGYGKLAGGITASFAAAQAAVSLFGVESESVSKAAATAQNILTIALSARNVQEIGVGASIVARTVADKAATAATLTSNAALKTLYTTIAANPIGALVTALGLAVAAFVAFNDEADKANEKLEPFESSQERLAKAASSASSSFRQQGLQLKALTPIIFDTTKSEKERNLALKEASKIIPGLNGLTIQQAGALDTVRKALNAYTEVQLASLDVQTKQNNVLAIENRLSEIRIEKASALAKARSGGTATQLKEQGQIINQLNQEEKLLNKDLPSATDSYVKSIENLTSVNAKYGTILSGNTTATVVNNKATDKQIANQEKLESQLSLTDKELQVTTKLIEDLTKTTSVSTPEPKIIEYLTKINESRKALQDKTLSDVFTELGFKVEEVGGNFKIVSDEIINAEDNFGIFYNNIRKTLSSGAVEQSVEDFGKTIGTILNEASDKLGKGLITKEAFDALRQIITQYSQFNKLIQTSTGAEQIFNVEELSKFLEMTKKINIATGVIKFEYDKISGKITDVNKDNIDLAASIESQKTQVESWTNQLVTYYTTQIDKGEEAFKKEVANANLTKEQRAELLKALEEEGEKRNEIIKNISRAQAEGVLTLVQTIVEEENTIRNFLKKVEDLQAGALASVDEATKNAILNNTELLINATQKQNAIILDESKTAKQNLISFEQQMAKKGIDLTKFTEEEKLKLVKEYLDKQVQATKDAEEEKRSEQKITLEDVQKGLQIISQTLSDVASIAAQAFQLQLDKLTYEYEKDMDMIVGDTEEANKKRIELEKIYQAEKRKIEKQAQLTSLKFTLAQAVAQGAQAVINALATIPPPANAIVAGIQAAVTAAQVAVIAQQIAFVQSQTMRRGGIMRMAAGGLAQGPSHEQGGIYAGGGYTIEGNEAIINRQSTLQYSGLLSQINQSGGGKPIMVQSPMDSRLVEALAKQKSEPIRAYVVEQDITKAQNINRRLEQLASF